MSNTIRDRFDAFSGSFTVCAQCGYRMTSGDEAFRIKQTGDIVHTECFMDYNDDNVDELCDRIEF